MSRIARISNDPLPLAADRYLDSHRERLEARAEHAAALEKRLTGNGRSSLGAFASGHEYYGLHRLPDGRWIFREWAPNAEKIVLSGDFCSWRLEERFALRPKKHGDWEIVLPGETLADGMFYGMHVSWPGGEGWRVPAYARYVVQDENTKLFSARIYAPAKAYEFQYPSPPRPSSALVYESHVGMAQEEPKVGSFEEYRTKILPRIAASGYNTVQLMAIMGHPYYGSFGYHVANFFSIASRFGSPWDFKRLVDEAHRLGLRVIIDLVHSHAVKNELEGLARIDGSRSTYFHEGARGEHSAWDSLCFDYGKPEVLHFLLSNCRFYLDEYHVDGFRFDGVTSMMYRHHGLGKVFTGYEDYFSDEVDEDAIAYLTLANKLIHQVRPDAITVAEDVSGMPGLASSDAPHGGIGFDYRMAMGVTDMWFKLFDLPDESWDMFYLYSELTNRRRDERSISYVECHDQSIVGGQSSLFRLAGAAIYDSMHCSSKNPVIDRAVALHKIARLLTAATAGHGYLNFMGNEFGHPEWVDFPREGNHWSLWHARRQWSLSEDPQLRFHFLAEFDRALLKLLGEIPDFFKGNPQIIRIDNARKIVIFERGNCYFCVNLHPADSVSDYEFPVLPGKFVEVLDTDAARFGGFSLRDLGTEHFSISGHRGDTLKLYLPSRTALVLQRER